MPMTLSSARILPDDGMAGSLVGRVWRPDLAGPSVVAVRESGVFDITTIFRSGRRSG